METEMDETKDATLEREKALERFLCFLYVANDTPYYIAKQRSDDDYYAEGRHMRSVEILAADKKTELVPLDKIKLAMDSGLVRKPNTLMFALAMCARQEKSEKLRASSYYFLAEHCKDWNSFALFVKYASYLCRLRPNESDEAKGRIGWGHGWKNAVNKWYADQNATDLAILVGRRKASYGWSHRDILRLSHPDLNALDAEKRVVFKYVLDGLGATSREYANDATAAKQLEYLRGVETFRRSKILNVAVDGYFKGFTIDHVHPAALKSRRVWQRLLADMDVRTVLKYLPKLSQRGFLSRDSPLTEPLVRSLTDPNNLRWNNILPLDVLAVLDLYEKAPRRSNPVRSRLDNVEYDDTEVEKLMECFCEAMSPATRLMLERVMKRAEASDAEKEKESRTKKRRGKERKARKEKNVKKEEEKLRAKDVKRAEGETETKPTKPATRIAPNKKIREALLCALNISRTIDITGSGARSYVISIRKPSRGGHSCVDAGLPIALPLLHRELATPDATTIISYSPLERSGLVTEITKDMSYDDAFRCFLDKRDDGKRGSWIGMPHGVAEFCCTLQRKCDVFIDVQSEPPSKKSFHAIRRMKKVTNSPHARVINWVVNRGEFELKGDHWHEVLTIKGRDRYVPFIIEAYARGLF